jgi:hypothetical protein
MSAKDNGTPPVEALTVETLDRKIKSLGEQRVQVEQNAVAALNQIDGAVGLAEQLKRELLGEDKAEEKVVDAVLEEGESV